MSVPAGTLLNERYRLDEQVGSGGMSTVYRAFDTTLEHGLELEKVSYDKTLVSEDRREALAAFAEKRKPNFKGQ